MRANSGRRSPGRVAASTLPKGPEDAAVGTLPGTRRRRVSPLRRETTSSPVLGSREIAGFRLRRHHLTDGAPAHAVAICRDVCGVQAQMMSAAYLQLWARNHAMTRTEIESALWKTRTLVRTSLMRQTLHLIPADEFWLYITAVKSSRLAAVLRVMARFGISSDEAAGLTTLILEALSSGPLGRAAIAAAVRPRVSKRVRAWMEKVWSIVRIPVAEGLICYGPGEGNEVKFIRTDQWLPKLKPVPETKARCALLRGYLRAYGPATVHDFSHWSGMAMNESRQACEHLKDEVLEVTAEGERCMVIREDLEILTSSSSGRGAIKLLPAFDPYLLAHAEKAHLLEPHHYKRVFRRQWWISPVILLDGKIAGIWSHRVQGDKMIVEVEPFDKLSRLMRIGLEREAAALGTFFNKEVMLQAGTVSA